jgi:hypothetical protein
VIYDFEAVIIISMTVFYALAIYCTNKKINETGLISLREDHEEK